MRASLPKRGDARHRRAAGRGPAIRLHDGEDHAADNVAFRGAPVTGGRVSVGIVGLGYWGPNLARNFAALPDCELAWCCDADEGRRARAAEQFRSTRLTDDLDDLLGDPALDAVVLATPVPTHAALATRVLGAGKHCFVEKPLAQSVADAEHAVAAATDAGRILMVGHLLEYHPGVRALKAVVDSGELGDLRYIYGNRLNLGQLRADENALWSLGAHDVSVVLALAEEEPYELSARGECYMRDGIEDVVFGFLRFPSGLAAHLHLSWLDPHKERRFTVVGTQRMATFDDMESERKVTIYDKGFDPTTDSYVARAGEIRSPLVPSTEPLRLECGHFIECVREGRTPRSDGQSGLRVVRILEGLQRELDLSRRSVAALAG
jgi:predicted dehydrogenase